MGKDPTGSRPVPTVATGKGSAKWDRDGHGGTDKSRETHTKTPTGSRPVPGIPRHTPPHPEVPGPLRAAPYDPKNSAAPGRTKHPTPKMDQGKGKSKAEGGGSY